MQPPPPSIWIYIFPACDTLGLPENLENAITETEPPHNHLDKSTELNQLINSGNWIAVESHCSEVPHFTVFCSPLPAADHSWSNNHLILAMYWQSGWWSRLSCATKITLATQGTSEDSSTPKRNANLYGSTRLFLETRYMLRNKSKWVKDAAFEQIFK